MNKLLASICLFVSASVFSQNSLPPCQGTNVAEWTDCYGTRIWPKGTKYTGSFRNGQPNGYGVSTTPVGDKYEGEWVNGKPHGQITRTGPWGSFVGEYKDGIASGLATITKANGERYAGELKNGQRHGLGLQTFADGRSALEGIWENDVFVRAQGIPDHIAGRTAAAQAVDQDGWARVRNKMYSDEKLAKEHARKWEETLARHKNEVLDGLSNVQTESSRDESDTPLSVENGYHSFSPNQERLIDQEKLKVHNERRVALVIGNAAYKSAPLDNPINDATDIANELKRRGFKVIARNNANLRSLQQAVRDFSDEFKKSDVGLIYYSGHGVETKGQNYLIPVDADIRKEYELSAQAYPASQLTEMMEEVQSSDGKKRVAILILDACRDNPLTRSWRSSGRGLARMDAPAGTFISFSTSPGSVASDGRGRNSPFTKHLLQAIRKPDVPIELMFKEVRVGVMDETKGEQIPWDSSSLTGDFYFSRSNARQ